MAAYKIDRALLVQAVNAFEATKTEDCPQGNQIAASLALGIPRPTFQHRLRSAVLAKVEPEKERPSYALPEFPDNDIPVKDIIESMSRRFQKRQTYQNALKWFPIKLRDNKPIGLALVGDPHVDDDGCNWPQLRADIEIMKQDGIYAVQIGDPNNNWAGRLIRLYANQETSKDTAWKLTKWFLRDSGVRWLAWLDGNHGAWNDGARIMREMNIKHIPMADWQAQFKLVFPNEAECRVWASHDFPGHSMWNTLHAAQKAAHTKDWAHIYACGHKHNWALHHEESASRGFCYWLARCRGYKYIDDHAERMGHASQQYGATVLAVIDPNATDDNASVVCFSNLERGADYLKWLRKK
jgi:hypothetical protein